MVDARERLGRLVAAGSPTARLLLNELLPPREGTADSHHDESLVGVVQRARFLVVNGHEEAGFDLLRKSCSLPPGLETYRQSLLAGRLGAFVEEGLCKTGSGQEGLDEPWRRSPAADLAMWLTRVQAWRETLGV